MSVLLAVDLRTMLLPPDVISPDVRFSTAAAALATVSMLSVESTTSDDRFASSSVIEL